jgi:long-chain acyl-CoA synthetase
MILGTPVSAPEASVEGAWPALSLGEAEARLCARGAMFELEDVMVGGLSIRSWKNQPASLAVLARHARETHPDDLFIVYEGERISYEGWFRAVATLAEAFVQMGVLKGDRVAIAMRNLPEWPVAFFAAAVCGAIVVPLNAWWVGAELRFGLAQSGTTLLIADEDRWHRIRPHLEELPDVRHVLLARADGTPVTPAIALESLIGAPVDYGGLPGRDLPDVPIDPDDDATIFYTSGTTGLPKGALGTHRNILAATLTPAFLGHRAVLRRGEESPVDGDRRVTLLTVPMFHVTACIATLMPVIAFGGVLVFMRKWDAIRAMEIIERERVTNTSGVPTIAWQLIEHPDRKKYDLSSLEAVSYGGAPSAPDLVRRIRDDLKALPGNGWGMTETSATVTWHGAEDYLNRPDSCGPSLPISRLKIMDDDGTRELPPGEIGELWAYGAQIVKEYWNNPEASARTFIEGWVRTGDIARLDEEGFCYIVDRAKDVVIRGGENIYSSEVENVLYEHPAVTDAALIGIPHRTLGEEPVAVVHLAPGMHATQDELQGWVRARLAAFKVPVQIRFTDDTLPRNANGKILKKDLKELFVQAEDR